MNKLQGDKKVIYEMAKYIEDSLGEDICNKKNCCADKYVNGHCEKCLNCIIDHFKARC